MRGGFLSGGGDGLVQPLRAELGTLQYDANRFLPAWRRWTLRFVSASLEIWNSDQGSQFYLGRFLLAPLKQRGILISMDAARRALTMRFFHRGRSLKYELIYPGDFATGLELFPAALENYFYNHQRPHQAPATERRQTCFRTNPKKGKRSLS